MKRTILKYAPLLLSLSCAVAAAQTDAPLSIAYKITVSQKGQFANNYLMISAPDATEPSTTSSIVETPLITACYDDGTPPVFGKVRAGDFVQLRPISDARNGKVMTSFSYSIIRMKGLKVSPASKSGCVMESPELMSAEGKGAILVGADPVVIRDDVDGLRITLSIAK